VHTISGLFVYTILNALIGLVVFLSNNRIEPREYNLKEYWTWKGSGRPPWFVRAMRRDRSRASPSSSADDRHNSVPPIAEENESQRGLNLQQSRDIVPGRDGSIAMAEQSMPPIDQDEAYVHHHHSSPMRGIAR
jgi:AGZA family xanthine/uracil permease-like MFS transporter